MADRIKLAFVLGIFALGVALFAPTLITSAGGPATDTLSMDNQTHSQLTERLAVSVTAIDEASTPPTVTVEYTDNTTFATNATTVGVGSESTVTLSGDNLTTGVERVDGQTARINATYPPMFAWNDGPRLFWANAGIIVIGLATAMIIGLVALAVRL